MPNVTKLSKEWNDRLIKDLCETDKTGIYESIARLCIEHGMPFENIAGFMYDFSVALAIWSGFMKENRNATV